MRSETKTLIEDDRSAGSVGGASAPVSSLRPRRGDPVILSFQADRRRYLGLEEASSPDWEVPPTIGELAVRLVAEWKLPRIRLLASSREVDDASAR
jgi:hypothetical protein